MKQDYEKDILEQMKDGYLKEIPVTYRTPSLYKKLLGLVGEVKPDIENITEEMWQDLLEELNPEALEVYLNEDDLEYEDINTYEDYSTYEFDMDMLEEEDEAIQKIIKMWNLSTKGITVNKRRIIPTVEECERCIEYIEEQDMDLNKKNFGKVYKAYLQGKIDIGVVPFNVAEYIDGLSIGVNDQYITPSIEDANKCIEYLRMNGKSVSQKTFGKTLREYLRGQLDIVVTNEKENLEQKEIEESNSEKTINSILEKREKVKEQERQISEMNKKIEKIKEKENILEVTKGGVERE